MREKQSRHPTPPEARGVIASKALRKLLVISVYLAVLISFSSIQVEGLEIDPHNVEDVSVGRKESSERQMPASSSSNTLSGPEVKPSVHVEQNSDSQLDKTEDVSQSESIALETTALGDHEVKTSMSFSSGTRPEVVPPEVGHVGGPSSSQQPAPTHSQTLIKTTSSALPNIDDDSDELQKEKRKSAVAKEASLLAEAGLKVDAKQEDDGPSSCIPPTEAAYTADQPPTISLSKAPSITMNSQGTLEVSRPTTAFIEPTKTQPPASDFTLPPSLSPSRTETSEDMPIPTSFPPDDLDGANAEFHEITASGELDIIQDPRQAIFKSVHEVVPSESLQAIEMTSATYDRINPNRIGLLPETSDEENDHFLAVRASLESEPAHGAGSNATRAAAAGGPHKLGLAATEDDTDLDRHRNRLDSSKTNSQQQSRPQKRARLEDSEAAALEMSSREDDEDNGKDGGRPGINDILSGLLSVVGEGLSFATNYVQENNKRKQEEKEKEKQELLNQIANSQEEGDLGDQLLFPPSRNRTRVNNRGPPRLSEIPFEAIPLEVAGGGGSPNGAFINGHANSHQQQQLFPNSGEVAGGNILIPQRPFARPGGNRPLGGGAALPPLPPNLLLNLANANRPQQPPIGATTGKTFTSDEDEQSTDVTGQRLPDALPTRPGYVPGFLSPDNLDDSNGGEEASDILDNDPANFTDIKTNNLDESDSSATGEANADGSDRLEQLINSFREKLNQPAAGDNQQQLPPANIKPLLPEETGSNNGRPPTSGGNKPWLPDRLRPAGPPSSGGGTKLPPPLRRPRPRPQQPQPPTIAGPPSTPKPELSLLEQIFGPTVKNRPGGSPPPKRRLRPKPPQVIQPPPPTPAAQTPGLPPDLIQPSFEPPLLVTLPPDRRRPPPLPKDPPPNWLSRPETTGEPDANGGGGQSPTGEETSEGSAATEPLPEDLVIGTILPSAPTRPFITTKPLTFPQPTFEEPDVVTGVAIPAENDFFDLTVTAQQSFGGGRPNRVKNGGYPGIITKARPGDQFVSIDGKRSYFDISPSGLSVSRTAGPGPTRRPSGTTRTAQPIRPTRLPSGSGKGEVIGATLQIGGANILSSVEQSRPQAIPNPPPVVKRKTTTPPKPGPTRRPEAPPVRIDTCIVGDDNTCKVEHHEVCKTYLGVSSCYCKPGFGRKNHRLPCKKTVKLLMSLKVDRMVDDDLTWNKSYLNPDSEEYQVLEGEVNYAIDSAMALSSFSNLYVGNELNKFYPSVNNILTVNATLEMEENSYTKSEVLMKDVKKKLVEVIQARGSNIGNGNLYVSASRYNPVPLVEDFNECSLREYNDCGENSICINTFGGFRCQCMKGYDDKFSDDPQKSGRFCESCPQEHCNGKGICSIENGERICQCIGNYYGPQCEVDGEVLAVAVGASVAAIVIILLTLVCLCMWSRRWKRDQRKTDIVSRPFSRPYLVGTLPPPPPPPAYKVTGASWAAGPQPSPIYGTAAPRAVPGWGHQIDNQNIYTQPILYSGESGNGSGHHGSAGSSGQPVDPSGGMIYGTLLSHHRHYGGLSPFYGSPTGAVNNGTEPVYMSPAEPPISVYGTLPRKHYHGGGTIDRQFAGGGYPPATVMLSGGTWRSSAAGTATAGSRYASLPRNPASIRMMEEYHRPAVRSRAGIKQFIMEAGNAADGSGGTNGQPDGSGVDKDGGKGVGTGSGPNFAGNADNDQEHRHQQASKKLTLDVKRGDVLVPNLADWTSFAPTSTTEDSITTMLPEPGAGVGGVRRHGVPAVRGNIAIPRPATAIGNRSTNPLIVETSESEDTDNTIRLPRPRSTNSHMAGNLNTEDDFESEYLRYGGTVGVRNPRLVAAMRGAPPYHHQQIQMNIMNNRYSHS